MSLLQIIPVLPCTCLSKTIDFYTAKLGFTVKPAGSYVAFIAYSIEIHFFLSDNKLQTGSCLILTDNVEDLYTKCIANDLVYPNGQITDLKFGNKEFTIKDNNGNTLRFAQKIKPDATLKY